MRQTATDRKVWCKTMEGLGLGECSSEQPLQWFPPPCLLSDALLPFFSASLE